MAMTEKLQIIQMLIDTESPAVLNKVKALLLQKDQSETADDYEVPQAIWDETEKMRQDRLQ